MIFGLGVVIGVLTTALGVTIAHCMTNKRAAQSRWKEVK
jgi:hypothetical protein